MIRLAFNNPAVGHYVAENAKCAFHPETDTTIGVVNDSYPSESPAHIRGGVIFTNYTGASIWMHVAGRDENWVTRDMLAVTFHYPFVQLGVGRLYGIVEATNGPALRFDLKVGFEIAAVLPGMFASGAGLVVTMEREKCRWLRLKPRAWKGD